MNQDMAAAIKENCHKSSNLFVEVTEDFKSHLKLCNIKMM